MRKRNQWIIENDTAMIQKFLEFDGCGLSVTSHELSLAAEEYGVERPQLQLRRLVDCVACSSSPVT
jgi:hypothetical protein